MSATTTPRTVPAQLTPAERATRKAEANVKKFNRDRARMLEHVKTCVQQAGAAIAEGNIATHDKWLDATLAAITSYRQFVALALNPNGVAAAPTAVTAD